MREECLHCQVLFKSRCGYAFMSYFAFHLFFVLPPILGLALIQPKPIAGTRGRKAWLALLLIVVVAFVYTTPWDNYLVWHDVWGYGKDRVVGTIGYVPIEEYLFFMLQPILTGLWLYWLLARQHEAAQESSVRLNVLLFVLGVIVSVAGFLMLRSPTTLYLGLILAWATPVLTLQWAVGAAQLWNVKQLWLLGTLVPTLYLWVIDRIAIAQGIWHISDIYTTGLQLWGLPIEEATFFLITNLMVVQGLLLFLSLKSPAQLVKLLAQR